MIKDRFDRRLNLHHELDSRTDDDGQPRDPETLWQEKISKIPVWNDYTPQEQQRLKEIFMKRLSDV